MFWEYLSRRIFIGLKYRLKKCGKLITKLEYQRKPKWKKKKKKKINRNQKRITPWDIHGYKREFHGMNPLRGQLVHPENYNYLNPTQFFDFSCFFLQLISLDCGSIVVAIHDNNFWIIAKLDRKDFVDQFVDILCALENR